jgi:hypothetical protein
MSGWINDLSQVLGTGLGSDLGSTLATTVDPIPGLNILPSIGGSLLGGDIGNKLAGGFDRVMGGSSNSGSKSSSSPSATSPAKTAPATTAPTLPKILSEDQGLAANAATEDTTRLTDMATILNDLNSSSGQVPVSTVKAEATAAAKQVADLTQVIDDEIVLIVTSSSAQVQVAVGALLQTHITALQNVYTSQETLSTALAQAAKNASKNYDAVGNSSSGSSAPSSGGNTTTPNGSTTTPSGSTTTPNGSTTTPNGSTTTPNGSTTTPPNTYTPAELEAMENPSGTTTGGGSALGSSSSGGYQGGGISDMLPLMMMPAMLGPMMSGMGGGQTGLGAQQASAVNPPAQFASNTTPTAPSDPGSNAQNVSASDTDGGGDNGKVQSVSSDTGTTPASSAQSVGNSVPVGPNNDVKLPDGTTAQAPNIQAATAARAALNGANPADAYQQAGVTLPPPGTPVVNPVAPGDLQPGDVGMWKDHQVMALGGSKVLVDGQVQPESSIASSPDFLGWMRPTQQAPAQPPAPAPVAAPAAPAAGTAVPVPTGTSPSP